MPPDVTPDGPRAVPQDVPCDVQRHVPRNVLHHVPPEVPPDVPSDVPVVYLEEGIQHKSAFFTPVGLPSVLAEPSFVNRGLQGTVQKGTPLYRRSCSALPRADPNRSSRNRSSQPSSGRAPGSMGEWKGFAFRRQYANTHGGCDSSGLDANYPPPPP